MKHMVNPFDLPGRWFKANLHTHTTHSDGKLPAFLRVDQYARAGYDVLAITDHYETNRLKNVDPRGLVLIRGLEYHPKCPTSSNPYHLVGLNVPPDFALSESDLARPNRAIAKVRKAGGLTILAHPFWCGHAFADVRKLKGIEAVEVYNATGERHGRPCSENEWAYALEHGMEVPCVAVDDAHLEEGVDVCAAWTWLRMEERAPEAALEAIRRGASYASHGPEINDFGVRDGRLEIRCSPAAKVVFMSTAPRGAYEFAEEGEAVESFGIDKPDWSWVRAVVTDAAGRRAWTNPIALD